MPAGRASLRRLSTHFGPISRPHRLCPEARAGEPDPRELERRLLLDPPIRAGLRLTLWITVRAVDPEFPAQTVPRPAGWQRIPDQLTLARALRYARDESPPIRRA